MNRSLRIAAAAAVVITACGATGIAALAKSARGSAKEAAPRPERGSMTLSSLDRGNTRQLFSSALLEGAGETTSVQIPAEMEVDATLVVFTTFGDTAGADAAVNLYFSQLGAGLAYPCNAYLKAHETVTFAFSPPLRLRAGDAIEAGGFGSLGVNGTRCEVSVFGYIPTAVRTEGMTVQ